MAQASDEERALHDRLLAGDLTASSEIAGRYLGDLVGALGRAYPDVEARDRAKVHDAASDALLDYLESPASFDPDKGTLRGYLFMAARGDLLNALDKTKRLRRKEKSSDPVELRRPARNTEERAPHAGRELEASELRARLDSLIPDPTERQVLDLLLDGERGTMAYAIVMDVIDLEPEERAAEVKRMKDRIKVRLRRAGWDGLLDDESGTT